jgi:hypothetical protein
MIAGKRYSCVEVDIWSCGIILFAMICGYNINNFNLLVIFHLKILILQNYIKKL